MLKRAKVGWFIYSRKFFIDVFFLTIITRGSPLAYFKQTIGVSSYQQWYFESLKPSSLLDIELTFYTAVCIGLIIFLAVMFIKIKADNPEYMTYFWLSCAMLAMYIQATIYFFYTGITQNYILVYLCAFIIIIAACIKKFRAFVKGNFNYMRLCVLVSVFLILSSFKLCLKEAFEHEGAAYIPKLGYISSPSPELINYAVERIGNDKVFATYAGAVETVTEQFQPSGTDYIIHVLGDNQREKYMESFQNGNFKYAATISQYYPYGNWIIQANWFFHRELYKNYTPVFTNGYQFYWEKKIDLTEIPMPHIECEITEISENETKFSISTEDKSINGTADVKITYSLNFKKRFKNLDFIKTMTWTDVFNHYTVSGLNPSSDITETYVPITIINGSGEAIINTVPKENAVLEIQDIEFLNLLPAPFNFVCASNISDLNWQNGISVYSNNKFIIDNAYTFNIALDGATGFRLGSKTFTITDKTFDGYYHTITLDADASKLAYPNIFEVLYEK